MDIDEEIKAANPPRLVEIKADPHNCRIPAEKQYRRAIYLAASAIEKEERSPEWSQYLSRFPQDELVEFGALRVPGAKK